MKILHTSDWHIGRTLYGRKRYEEFEGFLNWLADTIETQQIDALLVAGDIFDTSTPSNRAQTLYYRFLCRIAASACRHVVVIAGNHDSPTFLNAPKELLKALDVHVVGSASDRLDDEVLTLRDSQGEPELIVCAVPYLRDRDIRTAEAGETLEDKERKLLDGIRQHYASVGALAEQTRQSLGVEVPIVGMGHLFAAGGKTLEGDGVRELYVGSLAHISAAIFPECFDYVALGHLHVPQAVGGNEFIRYSGSPLPMGFGEATQRKGLCLVDFNNRIPSLTLLYIPVFQRLERISGDWGQLSSRIAMLASQRASIWLEIIFTGQEVIGDLRERLDEATLGTELDILRIKNTRVIERVMGQERIDETLDDLDVQDVFIRCLDLHDVPDDQRPDLLRAYQETLQSIQDEDLRAI
ncbi:exonuclease SbcCD subunit D C-terminal domain-containing protein [Nitrincola nitratireducens]|uniref:Nuclease SbcCD subunit D n=1 Tax=Nitrincola nitratireducens TaxID=1229521 RepID=W9UT17_9GAMM|nr:exonuclease SbcCD subunit D C-terminal domain-containing protein [Nitrincola nitratireducens]EXJ10249.1 Nuclease sbcCD subunit D [Nitrincola nitratireducens]